MPRKKGRRKKKQLQILFGLDGRGDNVTFLITKKDWRKKATFWF